MSQPPMTEPVPKVWNKRDPNVPKDAVYVGRPTKWGNPYRIGPNITRSLAVDMFIDFINDERGLVLADAARRERRGKHLVCWCAPLPCHADVLLEIAND